MILPETHDNGILECLGNFLGVVLTGTQVKGVGIDPSPVQFTDSHHIGPVVDGRILDVPGQDLRGLKHPIFLLQGAGKP